MYIPTFQSPLCLLTPHRTALLTTFGLRSLPPNSAQPPSYAAPAIIGNFLFAHALLSSRAPKVLLGFDHNVSPREDVSKYGEKMVQAGKMTRAQLKRLIRYVFCVVNCVPLGMKERPMDMDSGIYVRSLRTRTNVFRRWESAHANAIENFPFFFGSVVCSHLSQSIFCEDMTTDVVYSSWRCMQACQTGQSMGCALLTHWCELDTHLRMS